MSNVNIDPNTPVEVVDKTLDQVFSITATKREWIIAFNTLVEKQWPLGGARLIMPLIDSLEPIVTKGGK